MPDREHGGESPDITELTPREVDFAARLGAALRADAGAREDVEARVMRTIRAETGRPWWTRKHRVAISPLGGLALAASFAGFIVLGTLAAVRGGPDAPSAVTAEGRVDTVHLVRFIIQQPGAQRVSLVGDFNGWAADAMPLESSADGSVWTLTIPLHAGRYEYAFVVDGKRWVADPAASAVRDEFGGETSVLRLTGGDRVM
jgi:Carbohydrate-binding module 48 (Isoamylase N-terminal domain)